LSSLHRRSTKFEHPTTKSTGQRDVQLKVRIFLNMPTTEDHIFVFFVACIMLTCWCTGCEKLKVPSDGCMLVLEEDGTEVDDDWTSWNSLAALSSYWRRNNAGRALQLHHQ